MSRRGGHALDALARLRGEARAWLAEPAKAGESAW